MAFPTASEAGSVLRNQRTMQQWMADIGLAIGSGGLTPIIAATGPLGTALRVPVITVDVYGRVTALTDIAIALGATGDATGTLPGALTLATVNGNVGTFGDASHTVTITADAKGRITAISQNSSSLGANYWKVASSKLQVDTATTPAYTKIELDAAADISLFPGSFCYINPVTFFQVDAANISFTCLSGTFEVGASGGILFDNTVTALNGLITADNGFLIKDNLDLTKIATFQASSITTGTTRTFTFPDASGTLQLAPESHSLTAQTADIADTNFANSSTAGLYRVHVYLVDTTAAIGAGAVQANIKYTDVAQAQTQSTSTVVLTTAGTFTQATFFIQKSSGSISYGVTHTGIFSTAAYALYTTCEKIA